MTKEPEPTTPRPWFRDGPTLYATDATGLNVFSALFQGQWPEGNAETALRAVNAWDSVVDLEARIGELTRVSRIGLAAQLIGSVGDGDDPFAMTAHDKANAYTNPITKEKDDADDAKR